MRTWEPPPGSGERRCCLQARDLRTISNEHGMQPSLYAPTRTELFHGKWVEDAVLKYTRMV